MQLGEFSSKRAKWSAYGPPGNQPLLTSASHLKVLIAMAITPLDVMNGLALDGRLWRVICQSLFHRAIEGYDRRGIFLNLPHMQQRGDSNAHNVPSPVSFASFSSKF